MIREGSLKELSDGKLYGLRDMVKADCGGCKGCSSCCHGMGNTIILDPYDAYRLTTGLQQPFDALLTGRVEFNAVDGIILPNLKMDETSDCCAFLNEEGRCAVHPFRPGVCRLFPLGRYYENESFQYFLQVHECEKANKTKIKVEKWIDTPGLKQYEPFINEWHYYLRDLRLILQKKGEEKTEREVSLFLINHFYRKKYDDSQGFYKQFAERLKEGRAFEAALK